MKFVFALLVVASLAVNVNNWPAEPACLSWDPTSQTVATPFYQIAADVSGDYLDATINVRADFNLTAFWASSHVSGNTHDYDFFPSSDPMLHGSPVRVDAKLQYNYYYGTTNDWILYTCENVLCGTSPEFCHIQFHLHIGHLNHWGFHEMSLLNGKWHTEGSFWVHSSRDFKMWEADPIWHAHEDIVTFPVELNIDNEYDINVESPLDVYGTHNMKASLLLFREYPYSSGEKGLDLKFAFSVQYPYSIKKVQFLPIESNNVVTKANDIQIPYLGNSIWELDDVSNLLYEEPHTSDSVFIYQYLATNSTAGAHYYTNDNCPTSIGQHTSTITWNGVYPLLVTLKCRDDAMVAPLWCELPEDENWWYDQRFAFTITSNDICPFLLKKDPYETKVSYHLVSGQLDLLPDADPLSFVQRSKFVADDIVYFLFYGVKLNTQILRFKKAELLKFKFQKDQESPMELYTWDGSDHWLAVDLGSKSINECQNKELVLNSGTIVSTINPHCYTSCVDNNLNFYFPAITLNFKLDAHTFGLVGQTKPSSFRATGTLKFTYEFFSPTGKGVKLFAEQVLQQDLARTVYSYPPAAPAAPVASSVGVAVGVSVGVVAIVAGAAVAFIVVRRKRSSSPQKLTETTA
jgi:hypothetical protein